MAISSSKHGGRGTTIRLGNFSGGLALDRPAEQLEQNELAQAMNVHFDVTTGALQTAPGLKPRHIAEGVIRSMFWSTLFGKWLLVIEGNLYTSDMIFNDEDQSIFGDEGSIFGDVGSIFANDPVTGNVLVGALSGASEPCFLEFGKKVCIASGGNLQLWDGTAFEEVDAKKLDGETPLIFELIFTWGSRLLGAHSSDDMLYFSGVGDPEAWEFADLSSSDEDMSMAQFLRIGQYDSARIVAMGAIAQDLIVCKRTADGSPILYRLRGRFEDGSMAAQEINRTSDVYNSRCLVHAANDLFFFGSYGFQGLSTVQQYGDIKMADLGHKVNVLLSRQGNPGAKMWHIRPYGQIWLHPAHGSEIYVYHYAIGAFTIRRFFDIPAAVHVVENEVYVAVGNRVLVVDPDHTLDSWALDLFPLAKSCLFRGRKAFVIKEVTGKTSGEDKLDAEVRVGPVVLPLQAERRGSLIYGNHDPIYGNHDRIAMGGRRTGMTSKKANVRLEEWQMALVVRSGRMALDAVEINLVEVM